MTTARHRPSVSVTIVVFGVQQPEPVLDVLLVCPTGKPINGSTCWRLPGGFIKAKETLEEAAFRVLKKSTGIEPAYLEQLYTFGDPRRVPGTREISVAYLALVKTGDHKVAPSTDWFNVGMFSNGASNGATNGTSHSREPLPYDHNQILDKAVARLEAKVRYAPIGFDLLPDTFTLPQLQKLYEVILRRRLDKGNFRRKIESLDILTACGQTPGPARVATLYRFDEERYWELLKRGIDFEV